MSTANSESNATRSSDRRAHIAFWVAVVVSVLAMGSLYGAWQAPPSPLTGARVAVSGLVLLASLAFAVRIMIALDRARRRSRMVQD